MVESPLACAKEMGMEEKGGGVRLQVKERTAERMDKKISNRIQTRVEAG